MLAPFFILFIIFTVLPVFLSMILSLTNFNMLELPDWQGLSNYTRLFLEDAKDEIDGRHEIIRNTVDTMCRLRASAGIRFPGDPE